MERRTLNRGIQTRAQIERTVNLLLGVVSSLMVCWLSPEVDLQTTSEGEKEYVKLSILAQLLTKYLGEKNEM